MASYDLTAAPNFGRAGGPTIQHVRENLAMSATVSSIVDGIADGESIEWLPSPGDDKQFLIWGIQAGSAGSNLFAFKLLSSGGTDLTLGACTKQGPFVQSFSNPIAVGKGQGLHFWSFTTPSTTNLVTVFITVVDVS